MATATIVPWTCSTTCTTRSLARRTHTWLTWCKKQGIMLGRSAMMPGGVLRRRGHERLASKRCWVPKTENNKHHNQISCSITNGGTKPTWFKDVGDTCVHARDECNTSIKMINYKWYEERGNINCISFRENCRKEKPFSLTFGSFLQLRLSFTIITMLKYLNLYCKLALQISHAKKLSIHADFESYLPLCTQARGMMQPIRGWVEVRVLAYRDSCPLNS